MPTKPRSCTIRRRACCELPGVPSRGLVLALSFFAFALGLLIIGVRLPQPGVALRPRQLLQDRFHPPPCRSDLRVARVAYVAVTAAIARFAAVDESHSAVPLVLQQPPLAAQDAAAPQVAEDPLPVFGAFVPERRHQADAVDDVSLGERDARQV